MAEGVGGLGEVGGAGLEGELLWSLLGNLWRVWLLWLLLLLLRKGSHVVLGNGGETRIKTRGCALRRKGRKGIVVGHLRDHGVLLWHRLLGMLHM